MAVRVAATLRIADHIAGGVTTAPKLAEAVTVDADVLDRVLRHLATVGVLDRDASGGYALTAKGERLRADHPGGLHSRLDIEGPLGRADLSLVHLMHSVRTGAAAFPVLYGREFWDDLSADPARTASYAALMGVDATDWAPAIVAGYDWAALGHVVDVGGGNGSMLTALLRGHPNLRGTVVDLPGPVEAARATFAAAGLADRADAVVGSFFDRLPTGPGSYLLCAIVHDWDDESARTILRRCAEAAGVGGRVFVIERMGLDGESPSTDMDLRMLAYFGARERGLAALVALAGSAGLKLAAAHPAGDTPVVEFRVA
jgi:predicted transcriptional regulator